MSEKSSSKNKIIKWGLVVLLFISLFLAGASWYISVKLKPYIRAEITELVKKSTHGLYQIEFNTIHTNFITGSASIVDVKITPDTSVLNCS